MSNIDKQAYQASRYDLVSGYMQTWPDGEFVYHSDYQALLDELEDYKAAYEEEYRDKEVQRSVIDGALCKLLPGCQYMDLPDGGSVTPLEQVSRMIADYREQLQAAEKRIAELEARTLVPVEPTLDQLVAGKRRLTSTGRMSRLMSQRLAEVYRAIVSAAAAGKGG